MFVGAKESSLAQLIEREGIGICVEAGDSRAFAIAVNRLKQDFDYRIEIGKRARHWFEENGEFMRAAGAWKRLLK